MMIVFLDFNLKMVWL